MPRVKRSTKRSDRRKKILNRASGYFLTKSKLYQAAQEPLSAASSLPTPAQAEEAPVPLAVDRAHLGRLQAQSHQLLALHQRPQEGGIELDRKILSDIAVKDRRALPPGRKAKAARAAAEKKAS